MSKSVTCLLVFAVRIDLREHGLQCASRIASHLAKSVSRLHNNPGRRTSDGRTSRIHLKSTVDRAVLFHNSVRPFPKLDGGYQPLISCFIAEMH